MANDGDNGKRNWLKERRDALKAACPSPVDDAFPAENALGMAFSGGGIRSATISLGVAQALAKHKRWLDFDYLSTVSGGGYIGSFLTSLYTPESWRGGSPDKGAAADRAKIADAQSRLTANPSKGQPDDEKTNEVRRSVQWLREHSRYLAPNGASEYLQIAFIMTRNWLAVLYVLVLPMLLVFLTSTLALGTAMTCASGKCADGGFRCVSDAAHWLALRLPDTCAPKLLALLRVGETRDVDVTASLASSTELDGMLRFAVSGRVEVAAAESGGIMLSPLLPFSTLPLFVMLCCGVAYWLTQGSTKISIAWPRLLLGSRAAFFGLIAAVVLAVNWASGSVVLDRLLIGGSLLCLGGAIVVSAVAGWIVWKGQPEFLSTLRNRLTSLGTGCLPISMAILLLGLVDSIAIAIYEYVPTQIAKYEFGTIGTTILFPALVWLSRRLAGSLADTGKGGVVNFLSRYANAVALFVATMLYGALAVAAATLVQFIAWNHALTWQEGGFNLVPMIAALFVVGVLAIVTGWSTGFINLSSLHNFYASRLSRAYLGATNLNRLSDTESKITEVRGRDHIDFASYQQQATGAPLHLVNVTLNETKTSARSNIAELDRKGVPLVFAPEGIIVDRCGGKSWNDLSGVEHLSVGQLCAISGAAASPGMGARTSLGTALALTFANVRLGYWWDTGGALADAKREASPFGTFCYMFREMFGRYTRNASRVYLSDGGHFENSGAYELLRRGVDTIVVCDNGADPLYQFEDLENLVRKARLDLGLELSVATGPEVQKLFGTKGKALFLNNGDSNWRERARAFGDSGFALLLKVSHQSKTSGASRYIIWLKPCRYPEMPEDLHGYALANPTFPQQTTGDQFFDEAQWESYRMLGYSLMDRLLTETFHKTDVFREVARAR